ncbi:MAG: transcription termination/antitermination protein NusG [Myxococcales bacterium]|nr:transcription termination/antitermination protein NusG [Myxococcales bacterium]
MIEETNVENTGTDSGEVQAQAEAPAPVETVEAAPAEETAPAQEAAPTEATGGEEAVEEEAEPPKNTNPNLKWYVVHTFSGYENRAQKALQERIKQRNMAEMFGDVLVPTETVEEVRGGTRRTSKRKFFPGYMLVQVELNEQTWHLVKNTPKVTGFVGGTTNPPSITDKEVGRLLGQIEQGITKPTPKYAYHEGETVRVIEGPFMNFNGTIEEVRPEKQKLRVTVSIFGRATPVELDYMQVEKLS